MKEKIRFSDLVEHISSQAGVPKQFAHDYLKELSAVIEEGLLRDGAVSIYGFGNFKLQWAAPRTGHNPQTGEPMEITGRHKVIFRPHKRLREYINRRYRRLSVEVLDETPGDKINRAPDGRARRDKQAEPLPRASAAESIAAAHTIAERIKPPPRPAAPRERPATGAAVFGGLAREHADFGVLRETGARRPKALWIGVAAGVLALLVAVLVLLNQGSAPTPTPAERLPATGAQVAVANGDAGGGRPSVWAARQEGQPAAAVSPAATVTSRAVAAPTPATTAAPPAADIQAATVTSRAVAAPTPATTTTPPAADTQAAGTPGGVYSVQKGDSLWGISTGRYQDAYLWPNIYRVNLQRVSNPDVLKSGIQVTVPPLQGTAGQLTAQDNRDVATGYLHAYQAYKRRGNLKAAYYLWVANLRDPQVVQQHAASIDAKDLAFVRALNK